MAEEFYEEPIPLSTIREMMDTEWESYCRLYREAREYVSSQDDLERLINKGDKATGLEKRDVLQRLEKFCDYLVQLNECSIKLATYVDLVRNTIGDKAIPEDILEIVCQAEEFREYSFNNIVRILLGNSSDLIDILEDYRRLKQKDGKNDEKDDD